MNRYEEEAEFYRIAARENWLDALKWNRRSLWTARFTWVWSVFWCPYSLRQAYEYLGESTGWLAFFATIGLLHAFFIGTSTMQHRNALAGRREIEEKLEELDA